MKTPRAHRSGGEGMDMTPMIDVVFQLIIFFLVSSHLSRQDSQMKLPLPIAKSGETTKTKENDPRVTINVQKNGDILFGNFAVTYDELVERLKHKHGQSGDALEVRVRCDRAAPYERLQPILRACVASGIRNVSIAVFRPEDAKRF